MFLLVLVLVDNVNDQFRDQFIIELILVTNLETIIFFWNYFTYNF